MKRFSFLFRPEQPLHRTLSWGDVVVLTGVGVLIYLGVSLARDVATVIKGPTISLSPSVLPLYAFFSIARMALAYALSLSFALIYGYVAASNRSAEKILLPLLDVLQSVPILSFLPVVLLSLSAILPQGIATEVAAIVLIFTSQAWNLVFAWYQSLITVPKELREASTIFSLKGYLHLQTLELPFATIALIWNSVMSWAGGWFFLMAAEIFTVGPRDFRLPGLGSYLKEAAAQGDPQAITWGVSTLVLVIVALDQLVWRPLLAWSARFKLEMVTGDTAPSSWFYEAWRNSRLVDWIRSSVWNPINERLTTALPGRTASPSQTSSRNTGRRWIFYLLGILLGIGLLYFGYQAALMLSSIPLPQWDHIGLGIVGTLLRVFAALGIALCWTVPVGVAIGTNQRLANWLQPLVQIAASVPATAFFPIVLLFLLHWPGGLDMAAVLLMLMGTQWYLLFNVIAGATSIPQDLKYTSALLQLGRWERWRILILPSLFPYIITGAITASGGAWNASIVAEYVEFGGQTHHTLGIGSLIAQATAEGDYPLLLAATLSMILTVVTINRLVWRRLYRVAQERFRLE